MAKTLLKTGSLLLINGLDVSNPAEYISPQSASAGGNFSIHRGLLKKRAGTTAKGTSFSQEIMAGREFTREATKYNVAVGLDDMKRYNSGTSDWVTISNTVFTGSTDDLFDMAVPLLSGKAILCITNGIDNIRKWTAAGNDADLGGSPPVCRYLQEYRTYLVCANIAGGTDVGSRVQWSDTADPENWSSGNAGSVDLTEDGEDITGLGKWSGYLTVHKEKTIYLGYLVSTTDIFRFDRKATGSGTVANATIIELPTNEQIFLASDGLRLFNGISAPLIEAPVNDDIRDFLNYEYRHKSWGVLVREKDEVWIAVPLGDSTTPDTIFKFNYITRKLYQDTRSSITAAWRSSSSTVLTWDDMTMSWDEATIRWDEASGSSGFPEIHFGDNTGVITVQDDTALSDNGSSIRAFWESKDFTSEDKESLLRWQEIRVWARGSGSLDVYYSTDEGSTWNLITTFTLTSEFPEDTAPLLGYFDVVSSRVRIKIEQDSSTGFVEIKQFILGYVQREAMRA